MANRRLKAARNLTGLTQRELAEIVGVREYDVTKWETGRATPVPEIKEKVAQILNTKTFEIFDS